MSVTVDIKQFTDALKKAEFTAEETMNILGAGAKVIITTQKLLVPVDTGATRASIMEYFEEGDTVSYVDIGPSTEYAPYIEYGTSNPNYPIQPFVVPSGTGKSKDNAIRAMVTSLKEVLRRRGLV